MPKLFTILFLIFATTLGYGQHSVFVIEKHKPVLKSTVSLANNIYAGWPNTFIYTDSAIDVKDYAIRILSIYGGLTFSYDSNKIKIFAPAEEIGDSATVMIYLGTMVVSMQRMLIAKIPDPVLAINGKPLKNTISKSDLLKYQDLQTYMSNDMIGANDWFKPLSFDMVINDAHYHSSTSGLTLSMLKAIKSTNWGAYITFDNIKVSGPDGYTRNLGRWSGAMRQ